jgi:anti-anti-sigma factor
MRCNTVEKKSVISLDGRFDFSAFRPFRELYEPLLDKSDIDTIEVNFSTVDYLDSAALGMLLLLREKAEKAGKKVILSGCKGTVLSLFEVANFGRLFEVC